MPLSGFVQIFGHSSSACAAAPWSYRLAPLPPRSTTTDPLPPDSGSGGCVRMELSSGGCVLMELNSFSPVLGIAKEVGRADMADATNATTLRTRPPPWYFRILRLVGRRISTPMLVFGLGERWIIRGQEWERKKTLGDQRWW